MHENKIKTKSHKKTPPGMARFVNNLVKNTLHKCISRVLKMHVFGIKMRLNSANQEIKNYCAWGKKRKPLLERKGILFIHITSVTITQKSCVVV